MNPPELQTIARALRRAGHPDVAEQLIDAERGGATGSEILGRVGLVLREHAALRAALDDEARRAWDALAHEIDHAIPGTRLRLWLAGLFAPLRLKSAADTRPLAERFADAQCRAAFLAIRRGLADGSLDCTAAQRLVQGIHPSVFDSGVSDGDKQIQDYEKRQLHAALDAAGHEQGGIAAERFERSLTTLNLR